MQEQHKYLSAESFSQLGETMVPVCFAKINVSAQGVPGHMRSKDKYNWEPR